MLFLGDIILSPVSRSYLIAGGAAWLEELGVVPSTVDLPVVVEVDQIHQHFAARGAGEARGVPAQPGARPRGEHCHFSSVDLFATLSEDADTHCS